MCFAESTCQKRVWFDILRQSPYNGERSDIVKKVANI